MKFFRKLILAVAVAALITGITMTGDTALLLKGTTVNLADSVGDLGEKALIEGNIDFVYGPFAILEETQKNYGVTSKTETEFYIVSDIKNGEAFAVISTANVDMKKKLYDASNQWIDWFNEEDEISLPPNISIDFKGKLAKQPKEKEYNQFFNEALDDLSFLDITSADFASMRIVDGEVKNYVIGMCFGGYAVFVIIVAAYIFAFISAKKKNRNDF